MDPGQACHAGAVKWPKIDEALNTNSRMIQKDLSGTCTLADKAPSVIPVLVSTKRLVSFYYLPHRVKAMVLLEKSWWSCWITKVSTCLILSEWLKLQLQEPSLHFPGSVQAKLSTSSGGRGFLIVHPAPKKSFCSKLVHFNK